MNIVLTAEQQEYWHEGRMTLNAVDNAIEGGIVIGEVSLYDYDALNLRSSFGIVVYPLFRRKGYGRAILTELHNLCRNTLHLHQLYVDILDTNLASQQLFESAGYIHVGLQRDWTYDGKHFHDTYRYQYILN